MHQQSLWIAWKLQRKWGLLHLHLHCWISNVWWCVRRYVQYLDFMSLKVSAFSPRSYLDCNECSGQCGGNNCNAQATCANTVGSFTCACSSPYVGNGVTCQRTLLSPLFHFTTLSYLTCLTSPPLSRSLSLVLSLFFSSSSFSLSTSSNNFRHQLHRV